VCCGQGLKCYSKDSWWAECRASCPHGTSWSCDALGARTPMRTKGSWPGEDCTVTEYCNAPGLQCIMRDEERAFCVDPDHIPEKWAGVMIGGAPSELRVAGAMASEPTVGNQRRGGSSLYCFMAVLPVVFGSAEERLREAAEHHQAGIYSCNEADVISSAGHLEISRLSLEVWKQVRSKDAWQRHDWTVKADPDCVFWAPRLQWRLDELRVPEQKPVYIKTAEDGLGFPSALEVLTRTAVKEFFAAFDDCSRSASNAITTSAAVLPENKLLKRCLDSVGVGYMLDEYIFEPPGQVESCSDGIAVAFHPHKEPEDWLQCYAKASTP